MIDILTPANVEINIAWDDTYQIRFDLGERGGKRVAYMIRRLQVYIHNFYITTG